MVGPLLHLHLILKSVISFFWSCFARIGCVTVHCLYVVQQLHFTSMEPSSLFKEPSFTPMQIFAVILPSLRSSCMTEYFRWYILQHLTIDSCATATMQIRDEVNSWIFQCRRSTVAYSIIIDTFYICRVSFFSIQDGHSETNNRWWLWLVHYTCAPRITNHDI